MGAILSQRNFRAYFGKTKRPSKAYLVDRFSNTLGKLNTYFGMEQLVPYMN